jgi:hypothetical protein
MKLLKISPNCMTENIKKSIMESIRNELNPRILIPVSFSIIPYIWFTAFVMIKVDEKRKRVPALKSSINDMNRPNPNQ